MPETLKEPTKSQVPEPKTPWKIPAVYAPLLASLLFSSGYNLAFWSRLLDGQTPLTFGSAFLIGISFLLMTACFHGVFSLLNYRGLLNLMIPPMILYSVVAQYFMRDHGVTIDGELLIQLRYATMKGTADFMSQKLIFSVAVFAIIPSWFWFVIPFQYAPHWPQFLRNARLALMSAVTALIMGGVLYLAGTSSPLHGPVQQHALKFAVNPTNLPFAVDAYWAKKANTTRFLIRRPTP